MTYAAGLLTPFLFYTPLMHDALGENALPVGGFAALSAYYLRASPFIKNKFMADGEHFFKLYFDFILTPAITFYMIHSDLPPYVNIPLIVGSICLHGYLAMANPIAIMTYNVITAGFPLTLNGLYVLSQYHF